MQPSPQSNLRTFPLLPRKTPHPYLTPCPLFPYQPPATNNLLFISTDLPVNEIKFSINGILQCFLLCLAFTQHDALEIQPYCCMCSWPSIPLVLVSWVQPTTCKKYSEKKNSRKLQKTKLEFTPCQPLFS